MLRLRPFEPRDDAALVAWVRDADELRLFAGDSLSWPLDSGQLDRLRNARDTVAWTAVEPPDDVPVGHIELRRLDERTGRVARVIIDPARRGDGVGAALVRAGMDAGRELGCTAFQLVVYEGNVVAQRAYAAAGFQLSGHWPGSRELLLMESA